MAFTRVPLLLGTAFFGLPGQKNVRVSDEREAQGMLDMYLQHGHCEVDTARMYGDQTSEQLLAKLDLKTATIDTKIFPNPPGSHAPEALRRIFNQSLAIFQPRNIKVRTLYLHAPDPATHFEDTIAEIDKMHKEGLFEQFGLSNFAAWEVARIVTLCQERGCVTPSIYQGRYNVIARSVEGELIPCLRKFNIRFVIYNPLAGGLLVGRWLSQKDSEKVEKNGRYDPRTANGKRYRERWMTDHNFKALQHVKTVIDKEGLTFAEVALRWCQHHSALTPDDGIIMGVSRLSQLEQNLTDSEKGPLPDSVVDALEEAWMITAAKSTPYYRV